MSLQDLSNIPKLLSFHSILSKKNWDNSVEVLLSTHTKNKLYVAPEKINCQPMLESTRRDTTTGVVLHRNHLFVCHQNIQLKILAV